MESRELLVGLTIVWLAAKAAGEAMERLGQTAVLGELLAGVIVGPGVLGVVETSSVLHALAMLGAVILLFEVGLQTDLGDLIRAGPQATLVALVGVAAPLGVSYGVMRWLGHDPLVAVFVGATFTATSVGITARVLVDLGRLRDAAARVVLGAAVIDDVVGLVILAVVTGIAQTGHVSLATVGLLSGKAIVFVVIAIAIGIRLAPILVRWIGKLQARGMLFVCSVAFAVALSAVADHLGLAAIIGAFAAGLVLAKTDRRAHIEERIRPVADLLVPVFFVTVGMEVHPAALSPLAANTQFGIALLLVVAAVTSKLVAGLAVYQRGVRRWPVAVGMVPRGEVGLIFAGVGLAAGVIAADLYSTLVVVMMLTSFVAPPWLAALFRGQAQDAPGGPPQRKDRRGSAADRVR